MRVREALAALDAIAPLPARRVALGRALHRVLAEPAGAACDLPPFTQSAVDGYALRHADLASTTELPIAGAIRAGALPGPPRLTTGTAQRIYTGGWLPEGADTVLRQEYVDADGPSIRPRRNVEPGADVRRRGEELAHGALIAAAGTRLSAGMVAALAMAGLAEVAVRTPRIVVLVTGDEVVPPGGTPQPGQIHDANGPLLMASLATRGHADVRLEYVADARAAVRAALARACAEADLVLTTGGVSVGDHDHVPHAARELGARTLFWKVAQKPGKPVFAALLGRVPLLGLPGNPASVLVNDLVYVRRALDRLEGTAPGPHFQWGRLDAPVRPDAERDLWLRVALRSDESGVIRLARLPKQASHMLSNLVQAGALAWIPAGSDELPAATAVRFLGL
jgi:molybdopterin molybdotransferase